MDSQQARINAHRSWAATRDRSARTRAARDASDARFTAQARELLGDDATEQQVARSAESLRKAWFLELARKSALSRKRKK